VCAFAWFLAGLADGLCVARFEELVKFHRNKVGYYKIVTPKKPSAGHEKFVFKGGKLVEGSVEVNGRVQRAGYDSDDIARHYHLMQRQHFMHRR